MRPLALLIIISLSILGGCTKSTAPIPPEFVVYDSPDNLVHNFNMSWECMDLSEYRDNVLYNGEEPLIDGSVCRQFCFYCLPGTFEDPYWGYDGEVTLTALLFSGNPGINHIPGMADLDLALTALGEWTEVSGDVFGDPAPEGTQWRSYATDLMLYLEGAIPGGEIDTFKVQDTIHLYVVPVGDGITPEYKLWKWVDVDVGRQGRSPGGGNVLRINWTEMKALWGIKE